MIVAKASGGTRAEHEHARHGQDDAGDATPGRELLRAAYPGYTIVELDDVAHFEGNGDVLTWGNTLLCGHGVRNDPAVPAALARALGVEVHAFAVQPRSSTSTRSCSRSPRGWPSITRLPSMRTAAACSLVSGPSYSPSMRRRPWRWHATPWRSATPSCSVRHARGAHRRSNSSWAGGRHRRSLRVEQGRRQREVHDARGISLRAPPAAAVIWLCHDVNVNHEAVFRNARARRRSTPGRDCTAMSSVKLVVAWWDPQPGGSLAGNDSKLASSTTSHS